MATAKNKTIIQFPTPSGNWSEPNKWELRTATTGGDLIATGAMSGVGTPVSGDDVQFNVEALVITVPTSTTVPTKGARRAVEGICGVTLYVALLNGSTELSGNNYSRVSIASGTTGWNFAD